MKDFEELKDSILGMARRDEHYTPSMLKRQMRLKVAIKDSRSQILVYSGERPDGSRSVIYRNDSVATFDILRFVKSLILKFNIVKANTEVEESKDGVQG